VEDYSRLQHAGQQKQNASCKSALTLPHPLVCHLNVRRRLCGLGHIVFIRTEDAPIVQPPSFEVLLVDRKPAKSFWMANKRQKRSDLRWSEPFPVKRDVNLGRSNQVDKGLTGGWAAGLGDDDRARFVEVE
jgi:hypothetical protein